MNQPPPMPWLTDEQREAISTHIAKVNEQLRAIVEAVRPAVLAAAEQMTQLAKALQEPADTEPCAQHPNAPRIGGMCGGCTQYPSDMTKEPRS